MSSLLRKGFRFRRFAGLLAGVSWITGVTTGVTGVTVGVTTGEGAVIAGGAVTAGAVLVVFEGADKLARSAAESRFRVAK